jgi:hypothetical protein
MDISAPAADERVKDVKLTDDELIVALIDGRTISVPLVWYPRLLDASEEQRQNWRISGGGFGIHWPDVDEDLNTRGLLRGVPAPHRTSYERVSVSAERKQHSSRVGELEDRLTGYEIYDPQGEKIGKVDDLFVDENDQPEYIGVKMSMLGLGGSALIPWEIVRIDEDRRHIELAVNKDNIKNGPIFDDDEITLEFEREFRSYYDLAHTTKTEGSSAYGAHWQ